MNGCNSKMNLFARYVLVASTSSYLVEVCKSTVTLACITITSIKDMY
jgi:hypothetical protein